MLKRILGLAIVVLAACSISGCTSASKAEEPAQWSAIKFVPQETDRATGPQSNR